VNRLFRHLEPHFDLLHVHGALVPVVDTGLPVVFTSHGTVKKDIANMPVRSFHFLIVKILSRQLFKSERNLVSNADILTTVSQSCAEDLRKYHAIEKEIIEHHAYQDNSSNKEIDKGCQNGCNGEERSGEVYFPD